MFRTIRKYLLIVCVLFAITTLCSSIIQLVIQKKAFDSNTHILLRASICFLGASFLFIFKCIKLKNKVLQEVVHHVISLLLILLFIFCLSFFVEIGEAPPYPIFALNYTGVYIVVTFVLYFSKRKKHQFE